MLPMLALTKLSTSWPATKPVEMVTVAEVRVVLSASATVIRVLIAVAASFSL